MIQQRQCLLTPIQHQPIQRMTQILVNRQFQLFKQYSSSLTCFSYCFLDTHPLSCMKLFIQSFIDWQIKILFDANLFPRSDINTNPINTDQGKNWETICRFEAHTFFYSGVYAYFKSGNFILKGHTEITGWQRPSIFIKS